MIKEAKGSSRGRNIRASTVVVLLSHNDSDCHWILGIAELLESGKL